jgi:hypothetical protein
MFYCGIIGGILLILSLISPCWFRSLNRELFGNNTNFINQNIRQPVVYMEPTTTVIYIEKNHYQRDNELAKVTFDENYETTSNPDNIVFAEPVNQV